MVLPEGKKRSRGARGSDREKQEKKSVGNGEMSSRRGFLRRFVEYISGASRRVWINGGLTLFFFFLQSISIYSNNSSQEL